MIRTRHLGADGILDDVINVDHTERGLAFTTRDDDLGHPVGAFAPTESEERHNERQNSQDVQKTLHGKSPLPLNGLFSTFQSEKHSHVNSISERTIYMIAYLIVICQA